MLNTSSMNVHLNSDVLSVDTFVVNALIHRCTIVGCWQCPTAMRTPIYYCWMLAMCPGYAYTDLLLLDAGNVPRLCVHRFTIVGCWQCAPAMRTPMHYCWMLAMCPGYAYTDALLLDAGNVPRLCVHPLILTTFSLFFSRCR